MKIAGRPKLTAFAAAHPISRVALQCWLTEAEDAAWRSIEEVRARYRSARQVGANEVVFAFGAGQCAVHAKFEFNFQFILVQHVSVSVDEHV